MAAISYDAAEILERFATHYGITYPLLSDADSHVIRQFGLLNPNMPEGDPFYGIPFPGFYLLDHTGRVQGKSFLVDHTTRSTAAGVLLQRGTPLAAGERIELQTQELRLTLCPASHTIRPGQTLLLQAELHVNPGLHIYGPDMPEGYLPTSLEIDHSEVLLETQFHFPPAEHCPIAALNETVPVYTGSVTVEANCVLKPFAAAGHYRLQGRLKYQACTDSECYVPEELSFELPVTVEPMVAQTKA